MGYLGDQSSYIRKLIENATYGLEALKTLLDTIEGYVDDLETRLTAARAANLDKLLENMPWTAQPIDSNYAPSSVATPAVANTFSSWLELFAANVITSDFLIVAVMIRPDHTSAVNAEVELGKGAAGSEETIASVCWEPIGAKENICFSLPNPIKVAANTRIAGRVKHSSASALAYFIHPVIQKLPL